jgi:hypothetical protein
MRQWHHSGFSVHNRIRTKAADAEGRQRLARYMIRCPFALNKMSFHRNSGMVIYRSKLHATLKRNYPLMPALKWLRLLMNHIPDKYEHSGSDITATTPTVHGAQESRPNKRTPMSSNASLDISRSGTRYPTPAHPPVPIHPGRKARPCPSPTTPCRISPERDVPGSRSSGPRTEHSQPAASASPTLNSADTSRRRTSLPANTRSQPLHRNDSRHFPAVNRSIYAIEFPIL